MNKANTAKPLSFPNPVDVDQIRADFPILQQQVHGKPLIYLDNAATTQKPERVIDTLKHYYQQNNANIHRGVHELSQRATKDYENARGKVQEFINAGAEQEIIFVRGATEAINLVAQSFGRSTLTANDEIMITELEHHSNIVPWQLLSEQTGATLKFIPINDRGELQLDHYEQLLTANTRIVAIGHISNALGTINPLSTIIEKAHAVGAKVLVDGAQALPHVAVDVAALDCDFYVFSGHKVYGPTGIGVLYGKQDLLESMPPYQGGGDMIQTVSMTKSTYNALPYKFEAGTPHIAGVIGLGAAIDYLSAWNMDEIARYEHELLDYATTKAKQVTGLNIVGTAATKASILSFTLDKIHPHDIGTILDGEGIAIRAGHHCAMPIMERFNIPATARASFAFYNTLAEVDALFVAIEKCQKVFN